MLNLFKKKLIIAFVTMAFVGGVSVKILPMFHSTHTTIKKSQTSHVKGNYINDETVKSKNNSESDINKDTDALSDTKDEEDSNQNDNNNTSKQEAVRPKTETTRSSNNVINNQPPVSSQPQNTSSNINTETHENTNNTLEVAPPTIHYDRTTSIYANDNVTLLRVEYYVNNKLTYYSVVEGFDAATKSYVEKIYQCDRVTNIDPLIRTDVYNNGNLIKSY